MSQVSQALWDSEFPDIPKPEECEYADFVHLCHIRNEQESREWTLNFIKKLQTMAAAETNDSTKAALQEWIDAEMESVV